MLKILLSILFFLCFAVSPVSAQTLLPESNSDLVDFDSLAQLIKEKQGVVIYYKSSWLKGVKFRTSLSEVKIENALEVVKRSTGLDYQQINSKAFAVIPVEVRDYSRKVNSDGVILIGNASLSGDLKEAVVTGKITDFETGKGLPQARLNIDKLGLVAYTDNQGKYSLSLPLEEFELRLNYSDYKENVKVIRVGGNGVVNFEIAQFAVLLKEVLVTDRAADLNVIGNQMGKIRLSTKDIKELPLFLGEKDVIKSVGLLPGVQTTGEFGTGFFVRGGGADQNLILIEDVPVFNTSHLLGLQSAINSDGVGSMTLFKSGMPSKYGERASSVLDIKMNNTFEKSSVKGGLGILNSRLNVEQLLLDSKVHLQLGARASYTDWLLQALPSPTLRNSAANFYDFNALVHVNLNKNSNLSVFGYYSTDRVTFDRDVTYLYDNFIGSLKFSHVFNDKLSLNIMIGQSEYSSDIVEDDLYNPENSSVIKSDILYNNAKVNVNWELNKQHKLYFGVNSVLYTISPNRLLPFNASSFVQPVNTLEDGGIENSFFVGDDYWISETLSTEFGLRLTRFDNLISNYSNYSVEPRLSSRLLINDENSIKLSYNRNSQYINLITKTAVMAPSDVYKLSAVNVPPLVSNQFSIGFFRNLENNTFEGSIEVYYKDLKNIVEYRDGSEILVNPDLESALLKAKGYNYGAEIYLKKNRGKLTGWTSYTFSKSMRRTDSPVSADQINKNNFYPSPYDKPHNFVWNATYHFTKRWRLNGVFVYNTGKPITLPELKYVFNNRQYVLYSDRNAYRLPDYHRLDIAISFDESLHLKRKWKGSWTLSILNLYGHKNTYSVFYKSLNPYEKRFRQSFDMYQMYIIDRPIPTFTYNFTF